MRGPQGLDEGCLRPPGLEVLRNPSPSNGRPFSFADGNYALRLAPEVFGVRVEVQKNKHVRVAIREGEDPRAAVRSFCRAYGLYAEEEAWLSDLVMKAMVSRQQLAFFPGPVPGKKRIEALGPPQPRGRTPHSPKNPSNEGPAPASGAPERETTRTLKPQKRAPFTPTAKWSGAPSSSPDDEGVGSSSREGPLEVGEAFSACEGETPHAAPSSPLTVSYTKRQTDVGGPPASPPDKRQQAFRSLSLGALPRGAPLWQPHMTDTCSTLPGGAPAAAEWRQHEDTNRMPSARRASSTELLHEQQQHAEKQQPQEQQEQQMQQHQRQQQQFQQQQHQQQQQLQAHEQQQLLQHQLQQQQQQLQQQQQQLPSLPCARKAPSPLRPPAAAASPQEMHLLQQQQQQHHERGRGTARRFRSLRCLPLFHEEEGMTPPAAADASRQQSSRSSSSRSSSSRSSSSGQRSPASGGESSVGLRSPSNY
ncbi:hypothetical protein Esti_006150 [Eimeria stiedai]